MTTPEHRHIYEIQVVVEAANMEIMRAAQDRISRVLCPNPDHSPPCPAPWSMTAADIDTGPTRLHEIKIGVYATDSQARQAVRGIKDLDEAEPALVDIRSVEIFRETDRDGDPLDYSELILQYQIENAG